MHETYYKKRYATHARTTYEIGDHPNSLKRVGSLYEAKVMLSL